MDELILGIDQSCRSLIEASDDKLDVKVSCSGDEGHELLHCANKELTASSIANMETLRISLKNLSKDSSKEYFQHAVEDLEKLFENSLSLYTGMVKQALTLCFKYRTLDLKGNKQEFNEELQTFLEALCVNTQSMKHIEKGKSDRGQDEPKLEILPDVSLLGSIVKPLLHSKPEFSTTNIFEVNNKSEPQSLPQSNIQYDGVRMSENKWSDSWKMALQGVLKKHRRERIRDKAIRRMKATPRRIVLKSEATRERLQMILSNNVLFGDLDVALREEIIDAFQDIRVAPNTEIIKQGDVADNFYIIDVGEFDILLKKGNEPPILIRSKGAGEYFGELALMYDNLRNATVKAKTDALLWAVDRATFKSIMSRHVTGSPTAQILREAPSLKRLSTRDIVHLSNHSTVESFRRGQHILNAGSCMDKVLQISLVIVFIQKISFKMLMLMLPS